MSKDYIKMKYLLQHQAQVGELSSKVITISTLSPTQKRDIKQISTVHM